MISPETLKKIARIVGSEHLLTSRDALSQYATDGTRLVFPPDAVAFPADSQQVSAILGLATERKFPVIPR
ncbi:MAG: glycolate oxidase subunit GlcD, partial [Deltaproteobacteria bacterium]